MSLVLELRRVQPRICRVASRGERHVFAEHLPAASLVRDAHDLGELDELGREFVLAERLGGYSPSIPFRSSYASVTLI
jgi:hypothetical protein